MFIIKFYFPTTYEELAEKPAKQLASVFLEKHGVEGEVAATSFIENEGLMGPVYAACAIVPQKLTEPQKKNINVLRELSQEEFDEECHKRQ